MAVPQRSVITGLVLARLAEALPAGAAAVCAQAAGRLQPSFALVHRSAAEALHSYLATGNRAVHSWWKSIDASLVDFDDPLGFRNVNAPDDTTAPRTA
jgi:molybdopterin-guanine dinucleotide biosynthesis protein A